MNSKSKNAGQTQIQIFAVIFALVFSALLASGCSTSAVSGNSVDASSESSSGYTRCVQVMTPQGRAYQCNTVSTAATTSYDRYTYTKSALTSKVSETTEMQAAYKAYLSTLSSAELEAMNTQWAALASSK